MMPPPRRDVRWTLIVTGVALLILGILLLAVGSIVSAAVTAGSGSCGSDPCSGVDPGSWLVWIGLPFVLLGGLLLGIGLWWALR